MCPYLKQDMENSQAKHEDLRSMRMKFLAYQICILTSKFIYICNEWDYEELISIVYENFLGKLHVKFK